VSTIRKQAVSRKNMQIPDTFSLVLNYADPFLCKANGSGVRDGNNLKNSSSSKMKDLSQLNEKKPIEWPLLIYGGIVKNMTSDNTICLVKINGKSKMFKSGDMKEDIKLLKIYKDSVVVSFYNEKKTIYLKNRMIRKETQTNEMKRL
jgi:hypothetical protein